MAKNSIVIIAQEETYQNLASFKDINQLNETIRSYKEKFEKELTKSALNILALIHRYSTKYPGVSFLTKNSIASLLEISRRTVIRACQLLEQLGIIKQYEMKREKDMMQTCNAIVIQPTEEPKKEVVTQEEGKMSHHKNNIFLKQIHNIKHLNNKRSAYIKFVPKSLQHYQAFFGKHVKEIYGRVWLPVKKLNLSVDQDTMQQIGFIALEQLKQYVKAGKRLDEKQMNKIAYTISYNQLTQRLDSGDLLEWNYEAERFFKLITKG